MIDRLKEIKNNLIVNAEYMKLVLNNLDFIKDKKLNSNKIKHKKIWLKMLF